jgi:hypothetical protein
MTDIFRARRGRGALPESEDDDYSDSDASLTSHEDGYSTQDSGEDTSDYDTESDENEETETGEEYEQEASVADQETSRRKEEDSQPKTPEQSVYSTLPLVVENSSSPHSMEESNQQESIKYEPQINSDNYKTSPIVVEKTEEMIPQEQEQVTYEKAPTKEEEQYTQQQHVVEEHNEHQEECQQAVTTDANEQPIESIAEIDSEISKDPQEKRIQEHREYRRKLAEDPSFVPYVGLFWSHDDRYREDSLTETRQSPAFPVKPSQNNNAPHDRRADPLMNKKWDHGGYEELVRMEQENDERKHDHPEQDLEQHDTQPNRQHFNRPRPPQERHHKFNNNNSTRNNTHQPREEWPVVSSGDAHTKDEKTDVANASWATVTVDGLEEHGKPVNRRPNWNNRKASYKNGDRGAFKRDSHYKTQHNTFDKTGQSSFRENRYKQPETRKNSDHNENQKRDNESTRPTRQLSKNLGGWGDNVSDGETSRSVDNNNSTPTLEWNTQSEKSGWSDKAVSDPPSATGWNDVPAATTTNETVNGGGWNAVPEAEKANATWGDLSSIKESTGNGWSNSPKTDDNSSINQWGSASPKTSNVGWNKGADTNNNYQLEQNHASPVQNNMGNGWNHADRARNNSKDDDWKNKENVDIRPRSGWNSSQKEPSHHRKQSPAISKSLDPNIVNEMAAAQWSQPAVTVNIDLNTAIGNGWGERATIIKAENSDGLAKPVTTIDLPIPATSANAQVVNGWSQDLTSTEKPTSGWGDSSASSSLPPPAKTPTTDNTSIEKASGWSSAALNGKKASGWDSSVEQTTDKEKLTVADGEKAIGWGSLMEPAVSKEKSQEWDTSLSTVKNQNTSELSKPETAENKETPVTWDDSTAVTSTGKSPNQGK